MESKFNCGYCTSKLSSKFSLSRHIAKFHNEVRDHDYADNASRPRSRLICPCDGCEEEFLIKNDLAAHLIDKHKIVTELEELTFSSVAMECKFNCHYCASKLSSKFSLSRHIAKFHNEAEGHDNAASIRKSRQNEVKDRDYAGKASIRKSRLICPCDGCEELFLKNFELRAHLNDNHNIVTELEELTFSSVADFEKWKIAIQRQTLSSYTADSSVKTLANGDKRQYFDCYRSRRFISKSKNKRAMKSMGSNKINKACPSRIEMTVSKNENGCKIYVKFWKTHCGHATQIGRIALDKQIRAEIAGKLAEGVTMDHLLDFIRDAPNDDNNRLLLVDRKDMHNIIRDFKIDYATKRHSDDAVSIKLWVEEMRALENDCPVLYYKGQNEHNSNLEDQDFALVIMTKFQTSQLSKFGHNKICIDGTHGTNAYDIQLYTLMTIDEFGAGCPVAFLFSNRSDQQIFNLFFELIKSEVGFIKATVFMSDDAPAFYNAWVNVMGEVPHQLLCTWHVDKNWRQNLCKVNGGTEKKALVYKTLRVLLQLTSEEEFDACHQQVMEDLLADDDTKAFGQYFKKYYSHRPQSWAYCFRLGLGINTNMYLESFHKILKHIYLDGKKVKRLDKTVNAVMKLTRDSYFKRLIKISKNALGEKTLKIHQSHKQSEQIKPEAIQELKKNLEWVVASTSNPVLSHHIVKLHEVCEGTCLKCIYCKICVHTFRCSCTDHLIKFNICKHIHACAKNNEKPCHISRELEIDVNEEIEDLIKMKNIVHTQNTNSNNMQEIKTKLNVIIGLISDSSINDEDAKLVNKKLDDVLQILNKKKHLQEVEKINVLQKVTNQPRLQVKKKCSFFSTKKKAEKQVLLKKPSNFEENDIKAALQNQNYQALNVNNGIDHSYNSCST